MFSFRRGEIMSSTAEARVLIVDDEKHVREALAELLNDAGFRPSCAKSGQEALEKASKENFDVVLVDVAMPGMNGLELLEKLKEEHHGLDVIILTAYETVDNAIQALRLGAYDFIRKPFENEEILASIRRCLERRRLRREVEESRKLSRTCEEFRTMNEILRSIIERRELPSLLAFIVEKAREITGADVAFYGLVEGDVIRHHAFCGTRTNALESIVLRKGTGLGWLALQERKPVVVEDFFKDPRLKEAPYDAVRREGIISVVAVPFFSGSGDPLGVLYVANRKRSTFTEEQIVTLSTLAAHTTVAVEHLKLDEELKKAHEELRLAYEELKSVEELKSNILANVSHELRTPISIAMSAIEMAKSKDNPEERKTLLNMAYNALLRQNLIVDDLIEAAKFQKSEISLKFEVLDFSDIVAQLWERFWPVIKKDGISVHVDVEENLPKIYADRAQIMRVLRNLISNAIKFNREGGNITITARQKGEMLEVCVSDTGIGIPEDKLEKIFECFYQVDSSSTRRYGGTGLGLAIVKEIVKAHGGEVRVESKLGEGSTFCFTVPVAGRDLPVDCGSKELSVIRR
jgi:signal transduction histidine kinase/FixJ family two-component response regulator